MFLGADWRSLLVVNYQVDPSLLTPYLPRGVELDTHDGKQFMSLVALHFSINRLLGVLPCPPISFNEVNLRFYVKRVLNGETRRGVVFIREIVPSRIIAWIPRLFYNEPYTTLKTCRHEHGPHIRYSWGDALNSYELLGERHETIKTLREGSTEEFILEHYWGYTAQPDGSTVEYQVKHKPWRYWDIASFEQRGDLAGLYGEHFRSTFERGPHSVILAEGSPAEVSMPHRFLTAMSEERPLGWVLYDETCGLCSALADMWRRRLRAVGFEFISNDSDWVHDQVGHLSNELKNDLRLLLRDGRLLSGADAYLFLMVRIWWLKPVGLVLGLPGLRHIARLAYGQIRRHRHLLSHRCGLNNKRSSK